MTVPRDIAGLLPQSGAMVLIDEIVACDGARIECRARSHADPANPLTFGNILPIWAGIEYAGQAMAAHFALTLRESGSAPSMGLLGGLRDVVCAVDRLDDVGTPLVVKAERLSQDAAGSIYAFVVAASDDRELMRGRATVVQRAVERS
jgi:predicted hotdog family 3-hydroxylacyl-ACP dehydratase